MSNLSGVWYNQLGSEMNLTADDNGGLSGTYNSAVGDAVDSYILAGRFDSSPPTDGSGVSVGWAVSFFNNVVKDPPHSTSTWSGQYFNDTHGERILTNWLLTSSTDLSSVWDSTKTGHDTFTRNPPITQAELVKAQPSTVSPPKGIQSRFFHSVRPSSHQFFF
jgi:hypothetical protein